MAKSQFWILYHRANHAHLVQELERLREGPGESGSSFRPAAASSEQAEWANISSNLWELWNGHCIIAIQQISHKNRSCVWSSSEIHRKGNPGKCGSSYLSWHIKKVTTDMYYYDSVMIGNRLESRLAKDKITCKITQMTHVALSKNVARPLKGLGSGVSCRRPISSAPLTFCKYKLASLQVLSCCCCFC